MHWPSKNLSEVAEIVAGQSPKSDLYNSKGIGLPFFQGMADFGEWYPSVRYWCSSPLKVSKPNDILMSIRAPVGPTNICNVESCIGRGLAAIRAKETLNSKYLIYYLRFIEDKIRNMSTGSTFGAITRKTLESIQIPLPPLPIQKQIADLLDAADVLRKKTQEQLDLLDDLAHSVFLEMFGDPVRNEKGWEVRKLRLLTKMIGSGSTPRGGEKVYKREGNLFIRSQNIRDNKIDYDGIFYIDDEIHRSMKRTWVKRDDVLLNITGASIGRAAVYEGDDDVANVNQHVCIIRLNQDLLSPFFLLYHLVNSNYNQRILGVNAGGTREAFNFKQIAAFEIILPDIRVQNQFVGVIHNIKCHRQQLISAQQYSEDLFNSLQQKIFQ